MYRYPFTPYPNSWFRVAYSHEVPVGSIRRVRYLGEDLVIFRGADGKASVIDAYCPHLGADLSAGGKVVGNAIACPFHDWRFDGTGQCVEIPYCKDIPKKALLHAWPTCEKAGAIFFYYHAERKDPDFMLPEGDAPFAADVKWHTPIDLSWTIRMHIQEVAENAVDTAHFPKVHAYAGPPEIQDLTFAGSTFTVKLLSRRAGMNFVGVTPTVITYYGFGVVHSTLTSYLLGRIKVRLAVLLTSTPVDQEHVEIKILARAEKSWNPLWNALLRFMMRREIHADFSSDIPVWENKKYLDKPVMCRDDGPIGQIRKWARQFYSQGYQPVGAVTDKTVDPATLSY